MPATKRRPAIRDDKVSTVSPGATTLVPADPLLTMLRCYEAELAAFDYTQGPDRISDEEWDTIARETWSRTQDEIIERQPPATTAEGALLALEHVLQSDELFGERTEWANLQMLWLLVKAARDYIALKESAGT